MMPDYDQNDPLYEEKMYDDFIDGKIQMTPYLELEKRGGAPPQIEGLTDADVTRELTNLIWGLADLNIYIDSIDHLDDRAAYQALLDFCDQPNMFFPGNKRSCTHWSGVDCGGDEDDEIYLIYYADEGTRQHWAKDFKVQLPEKKPLPHPRPWIPVWNPFVDEEEG